MTLEKKDMDRIETIKAFLQDPDVGRFFSVSQITALENELKTLESKED